MHISFLHDEINGRLQAFLNGECLSADSRLFYPLIQRNLNNFNRLLYSRVSKNLFELIVTVEKKYNVEFPESRISLIKYKKNTWLTSKEYGELLCCLCSELKIALSIIYPKQNPSRLNTTTFKEWKSQIKDSIKLRPLFELRRKLLNSQDLFSHLILHGSCSTLDYTPFSDIDFMIVLQDDTVTSVNQLISAMHIIINSRKYLDIFNPYNHHGFLVMFETELKYYREEYLPLETLKYGTLFDKNQFIKYSLVQSNRKNLKNRARRLIKKFQYIKNLNPINIYYLLDKVSSFLLTPSLYFTIKNKPTYKKYSFNKYYQILSKEEKKLIRDIEKVRVTWPYNNKKNYFIRHLLFLFINPLVYKAILQYLVVNPLRIYRNRKTINTINYLCELGAKRIEKEIINDK